MQNSVINFVSRTKPILSVYISATKNSAQIEAINMFIDVLVPLFVDFEYVYTTACVSFMQRSNNSCISVQILIFNVSESCSIG